MVSQCNGKKCLLTFPNFYKPPLSSCNVFLSDGVDGDANVDEVNADGVGEAEDEHMLNRSM